MKMRTSYRTSTLSLHLFVPIIIAHLKAFYLTGTILLGVQASTG